MNSCGDAIQRERPLNSIQVELQSAPQNVQRIVVDAEAAFKRGEYTAALSLLDKLRSQYRELLAEQFLRARILTKTSQYDSAKKLYQNIIEIAPQTSGVRFNLANIYFQEKRYSDAIEFYNKELEMHADPKIYLNLGRTYTKLDEIDSAVTAYKTALSITPDYPMANYRLAKIYQELGDYEKALVYSKKAFETEPNTVDYHYFYGKMLLLVGQLETAAKHLQQTVETWPWHQSSVYNLALCLQRQGHSEKADRYFRRAETLLEKQQEIDELNVLVQRYPHSTIHWLQFGSALASVERYTGAKDAYAQALYLEPTNTLIKNNLANIYLQIGQMQQALKLYREILRNDPDNVTALLNIGIVYVRSHQPDKAESVWRRILEIEPHHSTARKYLSYLESES